MKGEGQCDTCRAWREVLVVGDRHLGCADCGNTHLRHVTIHAAPTVDRVLGHMVEHGVPVQRVGHRWYVVDTTETIA